VDEWYKANKTDHRRADLTQNKNQQYNWMRDKMSKGLWETRFGQLM